MQPYLCEVYDIPTEYIDRYPFKPGDIVLFLGEIEYMPGHAVIVNKEGKVIFGYHMDNFRKLTKEEV